MNITEVMPLLTTPYEDTDNSSEIVIQKHLLCEPPAPAMNVSSQNICRNPPDIHTRFVINTVIVGLFCVFGIVGNTLSLFILGKDKTNKVAIYLLRVLAVTDNCMLLYSLCYLSIWYGLVPYLEYIFGVGQGTYEMSMPYLFTIVNPTGPIIQGLVIWITVLLAVNRYIAVCLPLQASNMCTMSKAKWQVACVVILVTVFHIPTYFQYFISSATMYDPVTGIIERRTCLIPNRKMNHQLFGLVHTRILSSIFIHILPLVLLCIMNLRIYREIRSFRRRTMKRNQITRTSSSRVRETEGNISRVMVIIIVVFIVCQIPDRLSQVITPLKEYMHCHLPFLESIFNLLVIINSSGNFLIYYFVRKSFRQTLMQTYCKTGRTQGARSTIESNLTEELIMTSK